MQIRKSRWSRVYESAEEELIELLERKQISARRWVAEDREEIAPRQFPTDTQLWCAEGQLVCSTIEDKEYSLQPGDVLDIPANSTCSIRASFGGCVCYESTVGKVPSL
jgi:quercetin dioxygenase-like cupin family protein